MPKNNLIADNFLIQFFAHATMKYSAYAKESTLTVYKGNVCKKMEEKKSKSDRANDCTFSGTRILSHRRTIALAS